MALIFGIILLVLAVFLVVAVLLQQGKNNGLGAISGGNEGNYSNGKVMTKDRILSKITTVVAILFCVVVLVVFMFMSGNEETATNGGNSNQPTTSQTENHEGHNHAEESGNSQATEADTQKTTEAAK